MIDQVFQHIDDHFEEHIAKLREYLQKESISLCDEHNDHVDECAELLCDYIREIGGTAELAHFDSGYPIVFGKLMSKKPNAKTMAFYSLYDVMPRMAWR